MVDSLGLCNLNLADQVVKTNLVKTNLVKTNLVLISRKVVKRLYRVQMVGMIFQTRSRKGGEKYRNKTEFKQDSRDCGSNSYFLYGVSRIELYICL